MKLRFLDGGGAMGAMLRERDWQASPLGSPDAWPLSLKTMVGVMLASPQATVLFWGEAQRRSGGRPAPGGTRHVRAGVSRRRAG